MVTPDMRATSKHSIRCCPVKWGLTHLVRAAYSDADNARKEAGSFPFPSVPVGLYITSPTTREETTMTTTNVEQPIDKSEETIRLLAHYLTGKVDYEIHDLAGRLLPVDAERQMRIHIEAALRNIAMHPSSMRLIEKALAGAEERWRIAAERLEDEREIFA